MALTVTAIQQLYTAYLGRPVDQEGVDYWTNPELDLSIADLRFNLANDNQPEYVELYGDKNRVELITAIYENMFGRTPEAEGLEYWTEGEGSSVPANELQQLFIQAASDADSAAFEAQVQADVEEYEQVGVEGDTISLTAGADDLTGTVDNDTFDGSIGQEGGFIVNTLSSADSIDGGAGNDTLNASLSAEVNLAGQELNVQPTTSGVETINIEARSSSDGNVGTGEGAAGTVNLDAKDMTGVKVFGSDYSDGDLVIQNVNTLDDDGNIRNTSDMTIRMDHTSNFDSIKDASDLTVLFDDDYLLADRVEDSTTVSYEVMNQDAWDLINRAGRDDVELLDGVYFGKLSFNLNGEQVDLTDALGENGQSGDGQTIRTHEDLVNAINVALDELGLSDTVTAKLDGEFTERTAVETGDERNGPRVTLESTPGNELTATENDAFLNAVDEDNREIPASNRYDRAGEGTIEGVDQRVAVDVELEKVGRAGEGGDLQIGGKDKSDAQGSGIQVFNIEVQGNSEQPSNLGTITSTNGTLETINIVTDPSRVGTDDLADLTIRGHGDDAKYGTDENTGPFNGNIANVDASGFEGDLTIGTEYAAQNLGMLDATGGGDVTFIGENDDGATHNVITGGGDDTIKLSSSNAGTYANVNTGAGDDAVTVNGVGTSAEIATGAGNDVINGNGVSVTVNAGAGNDTIYAENTGTAAESQLDAGVFNTAAGTQASAGSTFNNVQLLDGRQVQVTLALPDDAVAAGAFTSGLEVIAEVEASDGGLTTERDLYEAVRDAINEDSVLSKLATASIDSSGNLSVDYLIDGDAGVTASDSVVEIDVLGAWADLTQTQRDSYVEALQAEYNNSDITAGDVQTGYDAAAAAVTAGTTAAGSDSTVSGGVNSVNAGTGDDVVVLSSDDTTTDTVVFDQGGFGNDTIVHFNGAADGDVLDFTAWLDNVESASGSAESEARVETTLAASGAMGQNTVTVTDFSTLGTAGNATFENMTDAQVLEALNADGTFSNVDGTTTALVGDTQKSIVMVENNDATAANAGEYKVYEVTSESAAGDDNFTAATLVGTADFGDQLDGTFNATNIA